MKAEFLITRQGKQFVLYAGLLDEAHRQGLKRIQTELLQAPSADNNHVTIVAAEVETEHGIFTGIGDASADNVGPNIRPHTIRMAETRAKARALRDAINVSVTALEELADDVDDPRTQTASPSQPAPAATKPAPSHQEPAPPAATGHQLVVDLEATGDALEREWHRVKRIALQLAVNAPKNDPPKGQPMRRALEVLARAIEQKQSQTAMAGVR